MSTEINGNHCECDFPSKKMTLNKPTIFYRKFPEN